MRNETRMAGTSQRKFRVRLGRGSGTFCVSITGSGRDDFSSLGFGGSGAMNGGSTLVGKGGVAALTASAVFIGVSGNAPAEASTGWGCASSIAGGVAVTGTA